MKCQGRRDSLEAEVSCIKWLLSSPYPWHSQASVTSAAKGRMLHSALAQQTPQNWPQTLFPYSIRGVEAACLLSLSLPLLWVSFYSLSEISALSLRGLVSYLEPCRGCHLSTAHPGAPPSS